MRADTLELGLTHVTISDRASNGQIRTYWDVALHPNHGTVFLVHTLRLKSPDQLDWFLDMVAAAKAQGSVRVVASSGELFGSPTQVTPALPDSTSTLEVEEM